jgi:hypothetical protein
MSIRLLAVLVLLAWPVCTAAQQAPALGGNNPPHVDAGPNQKIGVQGNTQVGVMLDGSNSFDPDFDVLTYAWKNIAGQVIGTSPTVSLVLSQPQQYYFSLTVCDTNQACASASTIVELILDTTPPLVDAPDITVGFTEPGGARGSASPALHKYLAGSSTSATDNVTPHPFFAGVEVNGVRADDNTFFPIGETHVTVAYVDQAGNRGTATAKIRVSDNADNDIFVSGPANPISGSSSLAAIYRMRGGSVEEYCRPKQYTPFTDSNVIVDSDGRVVFFGYMGYFVGYPVGVFRCSAKGAPPEELFEFKTSQFGPQIDPDLPEAFPGMRFNRVGSLHLARVRSVVIDDNVNNGNPQLITEDAYVMVEREATSNSEQAFRYRANSQFWEGPGGPVPDPIQRGTNCCGNEALPFMLNHAGASYSSDGGTIRRTIDPLRLDASGTVNVGGTSVGFSLSLSLFGGQREIPGGTIVDDVTNTHVPSGCPVPPPPPAGVSDSMPTPRFGPGNFNLLSGNFGIFYDEYTGKGLITVDNFAGGPGAVATIYEQWIDDNPLNDNDGSFRNSHAGCGVTRPVQVAQLIPYFDTDPQTGIPFVNAIGPVTSAPNGLYTVLGRSPIRISQIVGGKYTAGTTLPVAGLPGGIAAFPAGVTTPSGVQIIIRVDSPVDVLLTDSAGKKLGLENGAPVNDFGTDGFDSGPGEPRFFAVRNAAPGDFSLQSIGTGSGPFTVHVYSVQLDKKYGNHILTTGNASPGSTGKHDFTLGAGGAISFTNRPPTANAGPDQTVNAGSNGNAAVNLDGSLSSDPDGDTLSFTWAGPFGLASGAQPQVTLPVGVNVLSLTVDDGKGGSASSSVTITVNAPSDTTPPVLTLPASFTVPAASATGAAVNYTASATDAVDGPITPVCSPASGANFPLGTTTVNCAATDLAGNSSSGSFDVTVALGLPRVAAAIAAKGRDAAGNFYLDVRLTNSGTGHARNVKISQLALRVLSGSGTVSYLPALSGALPLSIGSLDVGASSTVRLYFSVPATVTRFSITETGAVNNVVGTLYSFSTAQSVIP